MIRDLLQVLRDMFSRTKVQDWYLYHQPPRYNIRKEP
jgi:hypothetical protein